LENSLKFAIFYAEVTNSRFMDVKDRSITSKSKNCNVGLFPTPARPRNFCGALCCTQRGTVDNLTSAIDSLTPTFLHRIIFPRL